MTEEMKFYQEAWNTYGAQRYFYEQFKKLANGDSERISFLFQDSLTSSKRYERFEKKIRKKLAEYIMQFEPKDYEDIENAISDYILNLVTLKGDFEKFAFRHALEESIQHRKNLVPIVCEVIGLDVEKEWEYTNDEKYLSFIAHIDNEIRKTIKNCLISKVIYNKNLSESNYTLVTEFSQQDMYFMISAVIQNAMNYVIFNSKKDITPCYLDFQGMKSTKNAEIQYLIDENLRLQTEIDNLNTRLQKSAQRKEKVIEKKALIDNPELVKENEQLKEIIEELKNSIKELEEIISLKTEKEETDVLTDIQDDKILFIGGHQNEQQKLQYIFKNAEFFDKCSMNIQANYLSKFDYVVFLTHYMSHSLYHKVKGIAEISNVPYIHCEFNNIKLIIEHIASKIHVEGK